MQALSGFPFFQIFDQRAVDLLASIVCTTGNLQLSTLNDRSNLVFGNYLSTDDDGDRFATIFTSELLEWSNLIMSELKHELWLSLAVLIFSGNAIKGDWDKWAFLEDNVYGILFVRWVHQSKVVKLYLLIFSCRSNRFRSWSF